MTTNMKLLEGFHNHHIVPKYKGGTDAPENLVLLHPIDHAIAHLVRYRMYGDVRDKWASNWLQKIVDPDVYSELSIQREKLIKQKRQADPEFDAHMKNVRSRATKYRKEGYQTKTWVATKLKMESDPIFAEKVIAAKKKAKAESQKVLHAKNAEKVKLVRQMRASGAKYDEISKETGFFISVISGILNNKLFVGVGAL
jgi:hypothetical protein